MTFPLEAEAILSKHGVSTAGWYIPPAGAPFEEMTLRSQCAELKACKTNDNLAPIVGEVCKEFPRTDNSMADIHSANHFDMVIQSINPTATPGCPMSKWFPTNRELMDNPVAFTYCTDSARWRADTLSRLDPKLLLEKLSVDPTWAVRNGLCDPTTVILKKEGTKSNKIAEFRYRYVCAASFTDQLVEKLLFLKQDSAEIALWHIIPSKSGMGLDDRKAKELYDYAQLLGLNFSTDVRAWDLWVLLEWLMAESEARILLNRTPCPYWSDCVRNVNIISAYRVLKLSDGRFYTRTIPGGMASGRKVTSSSNARMRKFLVHLTAQDWSYIPGNMSQGDDTVEAVPDWISDDQVIESAARRNIPISDVFRSSSEYSFCSQRIYMKGSEIQVVPERPLKMLVHYFMNEHSLGRRQARNSVAQNMRHHPDKDVYLLACDTILPPL